MTQRRSSSGFAPGTVSSAPSGARTSGYLDSAGHDATDEPFNPYADYIVPPGAREGYVPARTSSPPPVALHTNGSYHDRNGSGSAGDNIMGHSASGSYEPLLASYYRQQPGSPPLPSSSHIPPTPPPRNPQRLSDAGQTPRPIIPLPSADTRPAENRRHSGVSSAYSSESTGDDRLDPGLRQRAHDDTDGASADLRDDEDYSRPVLGVSIFFSFPP